jgi:two-component system, cell cycle response regulator
MKGIAGETQRLALNDSAMNDTLRQLIKNCTSLPTMPAVAVEVLELTQQAEADLKQIARVITRDPALAGRVLKTVNSSFYGCSHSVSTINHALVILGLQSVKTLVLGFSLVSSLKNDRGVYFDRQKYWRRSMFGASAARVIAQKAGVLQVEEAFLATLLCDIGQLVMDRVLGEQYANVTDVVKSHSDLSDREKQELQATHAQVGAFMAEQWKLPLLLAAPIAYHHNPDAVPEQTIKPIVDVVHCASVCADVFCEEPAAAAIHRARQTLKARFGFEADAVDQLLNEVTTQTREVAKLFEINLNGNANDYAAILKRANDALVELSLQGHTQVKQLEQQRQVLEVKAKTDKLTGLANRGEFDTVFDASFAESTRSGKSLSVIMIDVDEFKSVNDTHGHQVGDSVLKYLAQIVKGLARPGDFISRYGGEEIVMVCANTPRPIAAAIAETIRRAIAARPVPTGFISINITASVGVATHEPAMGFKDAAHLLKAADLAMYKAKNCGRNCVKVYAPAVKAA